MAQDDDLNIDDNTNLSDLDMDDVRDDTTGLDDDAFMDDENPNL
jgi:hypothetical protein